MNKAEIPLLLREQHEREMRHESPDHEGHGHAHVHAHSHGGKPCSGHVNDLEADGGAHSRHDGAHKAAPTAPHALPAGVQERDAPQADLEQQLRDIGFDD